MIAAIHQLYKSATAAAAVSKPSKSSLDAEAEKDVAAAADTAFTEVAADLARGLTLAGQPLEVPRFIDMGWRPRQRFSEADDPDRMKTQGLWQAPGFITSRRPAEQRTQTSSEDVKMPLRCRRAGSLARVIRGVLDDDHCAELISKVNTKGFTPALLNIGGGYQLLCPEARDGHRVIIDAPELASWLLEVLRPHLPEELPDGSRLVDLNERCRILCYTPGQEFPAHHDGCYMRPYSHPNKGDASRITVQLYLHDVPSIAGGGTTFFWGGGHAPAAVQPCAGSVLLFTQDLEHEGSLVRSGLKYTLRTEAMYRASR